MRLLVIALFVFALGIGMVTAQDMTYTADQLPQTGITQLNITLPTGYALFYVADNEAGSVHLVGNGQSDNVAFDSTNLESIAISEIRRGEGTGVSTAAFEIVINRRAFQGQGISLDLGNLSGFSMDTLSQLGNLLGDVATGIVNTLATQDIHCQALVSTVNNETTASLACTTVV